MPKIYRAMQDDNGRPRLGANMRTLGVRVPRDIEPDAAGLVHAGEHGMSVAPRLQDLPPEIVPKRLRHLRLGAVGPDSNVVWSHGEGAFQLAPVAPHLRLHPDRVDHGVVTPDASMLLDVYRGALAATQGEWHRDEK